MFNEFFMPLIDFGSQDAFIEKNYTFVKLLIEYIDSACDCGRQGK